MKLIQKKEWSDPVMSNDRLIKDYSRRDFVKITGASLVTAALGSLMPGCATINLKKDWSKVPVKDFDMNGFDGWYMRNKLYNGVNPNLILRHSGGYGPTYKANVFSHHGATPGIDYSVHCGEEMVAAADGEFHTSRGLSTTGRAGGLMLLIAHPTIDNIAFVTFYAHLDETYFGDKKLTKQGTEIKRGTPIGNVCEHMGYAKLLLSRGGVAYSSIGRWMDPDNHGENHSYMNYWDGRNLEINNMREKEHKQEEVFKKLQNAIVDEHKGHIQEVYKRTHGRRVMWDIVEHFKYLETLYEINPNLFPSISSDHYKTIKNEFYANQPIILTLPLKK